LHRFSLFRILIVNPVLIFLIFSSAGLAQSPTPAAPTLAAPTPAANGTGVPGVMFRNDGPVIKPEVDPPHTTDAATVGETQQEMGSLAEQKDTIESELRYAKSKLDAAQNRLSAATAGGHAEEVDKWDQEVKDWQDRVKSLQNQTSEVDNEVQGAIKEMQPSGPEDNIILPGDNLELFVVEDPSFNGRYPVRRGGYIIMPAVGRISVAGKTQQGAETEVRKASSPPSSFTPPSWWKKSRERTSKAAPSFSCTGNSGMPIPSASLRAPNRRSSASSFPVAGVPSGRTSRA
jgi:uncharacterized protein YukE